MIYRLRSYHGGLGDELQFTTLPEILTKQGHEVYLLKDSNEVLPYRNNAIKNFVWGKNPYIKGEIEGEWNLGDLPNLYKNTEQDFIKNWERAFGLEPQNSLPNLYRSPNHKILSQIGLIELGAISLKYNKERVIKTVNSIIKQHPKVRWFQIASNYQPNNIELPNVDKIEIRGNIDTLSYIYNDICGCNVFVSLSSGLQSVAAAARRFNPNMKQYTIHPESDSQWILESKLFVYPKVEYIKE